jgi:ankyrin repeat protein
VFCEQERQFLESYSWLRQLPEFFKPKELFSVMKDNQAQQQAEEILKSFEIEKDKIRCTDASALQALIPYVKRLLQLFPQVKESTTIALSADGVRNRVYQIETRRYIERISQSPLDFKGDDLSLRDFVRSDHKQVLQLRMVDWDEWSGIIKIHQVLQKTRCLIKGQYTVLKLNRLLSVNQLMDFSKVMQSTVTTHILLMACDANELLNDEAQRTIRRLFNTIKEKPYIKIFLSTRSEATTLPSLQQIVREIFGKAYVTRDGQITWSDLTTSSQEELQEKTVEFQGAKISLNELMSAESPLANLLPLGALLKEKQLTIGKPVPISNAYNDGYYIGRTLLQHRAIKEEIHTDKRKNLFPDLIASTEQEFKQICQLNPENNVHWLEKEKSGKLVWQQSQGSLETVRRYIHTTVSHEYTANDIEKLLEQAEHQRIMLISDTAGMGKSTVITHLSNQIKQNFSAKWVVRIDLNDHTDALQTLKQKQIDKKKAVEFVSEKLLELQTALEMELFKHCCEQKQMVGIVIMLDGFDEISPFYKQTVTDLLQALRQTAVEQLWVTTRPHLRNELEAKLQQLSYTLQPFSVENQIEFLTKFWSLKDWFTKMDNNEKEENKKKLETYAKELIKKLVQSISDKEREFTGIPLQTRMLAEAFEREVKIFFQSPESTPVLPSELDLIALYRKFIESKYDIYQEQKFQVRKTNVMAQEQRERDLKIMREDHQLLALKVLFDEETVALFEDNRECIFSAEQLSRMGIVQVSHEGKPHFIHRTFAEYCVADCLVNRLTEGNNTSEQIEKFILKDIFVEGEYKVIRVFIDGLMLSSNISKEVLKQYGNGIHDLGEEGVLTLHRAAQEDNANIIGFLLDSVQTAAHTDTASKLLLAQDEDRETAWYKAAFGGNKQALVKLWEHAKEKLTPEELNMKLLLAKDIVGDTAWDVAAKKGDLGVLQQLWEWAKEKLTTEEIKYNFFLGKNNIEETAFHGAAIMGRTETLETIWKWAKEELTTEELKKEMLLAKGHKEQTVWHNATLEGNTVFLEKLWEWAEEKLTTEEVRNKILLAQDERERTIWHCASQRGNLQLLEKLWVWAKQNLTSEELKIKLLLAKDIWGKPAWYVAVEEGNLQVLEKHLEWAEEVLTPGELKNKFLLATVELRNTYSSSRQYSTLLQKAAEWAKQRYF